MTLGILLLIAAAVLTGWPVWLLADHVQRASGRHCPFWRAFAWTCAYLGDMLLGGLLAVWGVILVVE